MVLIKETLQPGRQVHYNGITQVPVEDCEESIFAAFLEFAINRTQNDSEIYENAATSSDQGNEKVLFLQLSYRKNEVLGKLKMQRSDVSVIRSLEKVKNEYFHIRHLKEIENVRPETIEDALTFSIQRECRTLELYKKLEKNMAHESTKALFEFLVNFQYDIMNFLSLQHSAAIMNMQKA